MASPQSSAATDALEAPPLASITLLMAKPLANQSSGLERALSVLGQAKLAGMIPGMPFEASESGCAGEIRWDDHQVRFIEVIAPAPGLDEMIQFTRMDNNALASLKTHVSHVLCFYQGEANDPVLRVQALFRLAAALVPMGVLGIIHTDAWQCFLPKALGPLADPARTKDMHEGLAHMALCNLIPFHSPKGTWWTSKGNHVFGIPDITLWDDGRFGVKPVQTIFSSLFSYLQSGAKIQPGHTMELAGTTFVAGEVTEHRDHLCGPGATLALRPAKGGAPQRGGAAARRQANVPSAEDEQAAARIKGRFYGFIMGGVFIACAIGAPATHYTQMKLIMSGLGAVCLLYAFRPRGWL
jgi:hypothetical protein